MSDESYAVRQRPPLPTACGICGLHPDDAERTVATRTGRLYPACCTVAVPPDKGGGFRSMTNAEHPPLKEREMPDHMALRAAVLDPIRREAGMPEDESEPPTDDQLNRYIELLEASVVGNKMAMDTIRSLR